MPERGLRSGSVGNEEQLHRRGIIRYGSQRSSSLLDDGDENANDQQTSRTIPIPTLQRLARDAFLYGLADGHAAKLSSVAQGDRIENGVCAGEVPRQISIIPQEDTFNPGLASIPASTALLYDSAFWDGLLSEAARRRLLSDEFLTSLCSSGIPPTRLELRGGLTDLGVTDRFLVKAPRDVASAASSHAQQSFASASEMIIANIQHLRLSGGSGERGSSDMAAERLVGQNDLETFLHRLSRTAVDLETLTLGPGLLQHELSNTWIGSVKAISLSCRKLRSLQLYGLAFGGTGRSDSGSSIGGTTAPSSISALFEALARNCQSLEELSLARSTGIQDRHGQALLLELRDGSMSVSNLIDLDLSYTRVGSLTFSALCNRQLGYASDSTSGRGIQKLNLDGTDVDISWLRRILSSLNHLEDLSILSCPNLSCGPDVWDVFADAGASEAAPRMTSLALELWFHSNSVEQVENQFSLNGNNLDDDHQVALAAQYEIDYADGEGERSALGDFIHDQGWSCRHCTLINEARCHRCAACNARRYPHNGKTIDGDDWFDSDCSDDGSEGIEAKKRASLYTFPSLEEYPFNTLTAVLRITCDDNENDTAFASAPTSLASKVMNALPRGIATLKLSLCDGDGNALRYGCVLGSELAMRFIQRHGPSMQELELKSIRIDKAPSLQDLCTGLSELRVLKIFGRRDLGIATAAVLREISTPLDRNVSAGCPNLEVLQLCITDSVVVTREHTTDSIDDDDDVAFHSPYLKRLWLEGCGNVEKLELKTPCIERLTIIECDSLAHIGFVDFDSLTNPNPLQRLRLHGTSVSPYSIASLKLPNLQNLDVEGMPHIEDWEFGSMVDAASHSLTELRVRQCRSLGAFSQWYRGTASFHPLSVLELSRPSSSFNIPSFQILFDNKRRLRDVAIHDASGLQGYICGQASLVPDVPQDDGLAELVSSQASISRIGGGAIDEASSLASTEILGGRGIERILINFVESSRNGGNTEYGFPPTLNGFQRKLVHDHAESLNLEHESIRLNTGVKVVRVRRKTTTHGETSYGDQFGGGNDNNGLHPVTVTPEQTRQNEINVESQTVPSNLERALLAEAVSPQQVTFAPVATGNNGADEDVGSFAEEDVGSDNGDMFQLDVDKDDADNIEEEEETEQVPSSPPTRARSRRERRKARKAEKRGEVYKYDEPRDNDEQASSSESDGEDQDDFAFDPLLQQGRFARFDTKALRRLINLAHKLPSDATGRAVCIRFLRGACPYQGHKDGGDCAYAHFDVKPSTAKRFAPLMDYVCGRHEDTAVGRRGSSRRKNQDRNQRELSSSYGSNPGSYGSDTGAQLMEAHVSSRGSGGRSRGGRRRRRTGSLGEEEDTDHQGSASEDGISSRGSSPGRNWLGSSPMLSSSPRSFDAPRAALMPLNLHRLIRLELNDCHGLTGACLEGPNLVRLCLRNCSTLATLDLRSPKLTTLDVSECGRLSKFPLHDFSLRGLRVANLTGCKSLNEAFCSRLVNHCRALRQLHIFGSGASEKASNARTRTRMKTKAGLSKLTAGRPKLTLCATKKEWRVLQAKREEVGERGDGLLEEAGGVQEGY